MRAVSTVMYAMLITVSLACAGAVLIQAEPILTAFVAQAQAADRTVVVPWGDWVSSTLSVIGTLPIGELVFGWMVALLASAGLPSQIAALLKGGLSEQMLNRAIQFGINSVAGAVKGRTLDFVTANEVVATAADYVIQRGPAWLVDWLGGLEGIKARILSRIDLTKESKIVPETHEVVPAMATATGDTPVGGPVPRAGV